MKDPKKHLWYYNSLLVVFKAAYEAKHTPWLVDELDRVLGELENLVTAATNE